MPKDSKGNFHMSAQRAMAADKSGALGSAMKAKHKAPDGVGAMDQMEEHDGGGDAEHQGIHDGLRAAQAEHGGKHMHVHHGDDGKLQSHHIGHDGETQGPHDHANIEALKDHMDKFLGEEENEWSGSDYAPEGHKGY